MRIEHMPSRTPGTRKRIVTLQTPAERGLSDDELIRLCDNAAGITYNKTTGSYDLTGNDFGPHSLGGRCERWGDQVQVAVYTD